MYTEEVLSTPKPVIYNPIPRIVAIKQIQKFRHALDHGHLKPKYLTYGMVHRKPHIEAYLNKEYKEITTHEDKINGPHPDHEWALGYFYMLEKSAEGNKRIVFCVAPILVLTQPKSEPSSEIPVWDPLDPNCPYRYTYGINADPANTDDDLGFYDMGEMWP